MLYYLVRALKLSLLWLDLILVSALLYVLAFLPQRLLDTFYPQFFRFWCRVFARALYVDLRLHQKNRLPLPPQYILIANHPSAFEDIGIPALFPVYSLAKDEVKDWFIAGRISRAAGTLYVKRESRESRRVAGARIEEELAKGNNVALYPEGGCKGRRIFSSFRYGAFDISLRTGIPILPVFIHYEAQEDFEWAPGQTLVQKMAHFLAAQNNRANYYVFDAIDPGRFGDKEAYYQYVYGLYLKWQARYLE